MAKLQQRISNRMVAALRADKDTLFWDRELVGFGVRVHASGARVYVAQTRGPHGPKRVTVGRHGVINADEARRRAAMIRLWSRSRRNSPTGRRWPIWRRAT